LTCAEIFSADPGLELQIRALEVTLKMA
jgi:hypothetical protein